MWVMLLYNSSASLWQCSWCVWAMQVIAVDTNGAGDTFATAYMLAMAGRSRNPGAAATWAASRSVPPCSSPCARSNFSLSTWPRAAWTERVVGMGGRADALRTHHALLTGDGAAQSGHAGTGVQAAVCPGWHCAGFFLCTVPAVGASAGASLLFPAQHCSPSTPASTVTFVQHADQC